MKLIDWFKSRSTQEWLMIAAIAMILIMIATRWGYTTHTAGEAFRERFTPPTATTTEKTDSVAK